MGESREESLCERGPITYCDRGAIRSTVCVFREEERREDGMAQGKQKGHRIMTLSRWLPTRENESILVFRGRK